MKPAASHNSLRKTKLFLLAAIVSTSLLGCASRRGGDGVMPSETKSRFPLAVEQYERIADKRLSAFHDNHDFPGATLAFVLDDGRAGSVAVGVADKRDKTPMSPDSRMLSGSIGKTYVAAVALLLLEEQRIDLDSKISTWFGDEDWFPRLPNADQITLRMLMNHSSGIPEHIQAPTFLAAVSANPERIWRPEELVAYVLDTPPLFPAGQGWSYADTNYILVGMIIERVTGRKYYDLLNERILKFYALDDTFPSDQRVLPGLVNGYTRPNNPFDIPEQASIDGRCYFHPQMEWTGGGLVSTSPDLARWAKLLYGDDVIKPQSKEQMFQGIDTPRFGPEHQYGLGVIIRNSPNGVVYGHSGWFPGYISAMAWYDDLDLALAMQFNFDGAAGFSDMEALLDAVAADIANGAAPAVDSE